VEYLSNPVYTDGNKAYYPTIIEEGDGYKMWYASQTDIMMTTSSDGIVWMDPKFCTGLISANHPLVKKIGDSYRIWYWDTSAQPVPYTINAIRTAISSGGVDWQYDQPLTQDDEYRLITGSGTGWNSGSYGPGDVIYNPSGYNSLDDENIWNNKYVMYYMTTNGNNEYVGLAYSADGKHWKRYGNAPVLKPCTEDDDPSVGWDYRSVGYPTVINDADGWHMWFCGGPNTNYGIGYAWSNDGINWTKDAANPIFHKDDGVPWRNERTYTPVVIGNQMWFSGKYASTGVYAIGYATASPPCIPVSLDSLTADPLVVQLGNEVNFEATIADGCGKIDALWDFYDGTYEPQSNVESPVTATHTYASAGVYTVVLSVIDEAFIPDGDNIMVVVYDPTGGFVTGGGWIDSPQGAYTPDPSLTGKAHFGFVAKYEKKTKLPVGNTEFVFKAGNINFHSSGHQWLVVNKNESRAQFKGAGTINGDGDYKFMLRAGDGEHDTFWIQIWEEDEVNGDEFVIYDNGGDQMIGGGSIVIHAN
jgi:hypothetical protein